MLGSVSKRRQAELGMLLVAFVWGSTFVITKNALADIGPFLFLGIRFILAFLVLAAFAWSEIQKIDRATLLTGSLIGIFLFIGYTFQTVGLQYTTASKAGFITGLNVVLVPVLYVLIERKLPTLHTLGSVVVATTGLYLMSVPPGTFRLAYGDLLMLVCAFGFAMQIILVNHYSYRFNPVAITGVQILFVGIWCLLIGVMVEPLPQQITYNAGSAIIITAVLATALAFLLQNGMQKYSTPTRFAIVLATEPVFAGITGYYWGGETLSIRALTGAAMILIAMLIAILSRSD